MFAGQPVFSNPQICGFGLPTVDVSDDWANLPSGRTALSVR
jgi:hypothetical protein